MRHAENDPFAKAALALGFCSDAQVEKCLRIQADTTEGLSLGHSLLREGFITDEQYSKILTTLRSGFRKEDSAPNRAKMPPEPAAAIERDPLTRQDQEDELFGKLAVREGWISQADLDLCLGGEQPGAPKRSLEEIMVSRGFVEPARARALLESLSRKLMCCRTCEASFSVLSIALSRQIRCPKCKGPLEEGKLINRALVDDSFAARAGVKAPSAPIRPPAFRKGALSRRRNRSR
jgi:hypothetical protein